MKKWLRLLLLFIFIVVSVCFFGIVVTSKILPSKYLYVLGGFLLLYTGLLLYFVYIVKKQNIVKTILIVIEVVLLIIMSMGIYYIQTTLNFLDDTAAETYKTENYIVLVNSNSSLKEIKDIKDKKIGYIYNESSNINKAITKLKETTSFEDKKITTYTSLIEKLYAKDIDALLIEASTKEILLEELPDLDEKTRVLYEYSIQVDIESIIKDVDVATEPFSIYISGIDIFGRISSVSRSDVNIIVTVNPKTNQILITSIPRDYYVRLHGTTGLKDKLTHAGIYGVQMSVQTIEDLLNTDINYYVRVNFTTLINSINVIDGVDVYSEYTFNARGYHFTKGFNHMNGEQALAFARERYAFSDGDRMRGKNQQAVIAAIIDKMTSPSMITKFTSILKTLNGTFQTNMTTDKMLNLVNYQIDKMPKWNITTSNLDGSGASEYTYSYGGSKLYVMVPYEDSVKNAIEKIEKVQNGEVLKSTVVENSGKVNKVIPITTKKTTTTANTTTTSTATTTTSVLTTTTTSTQVVQPENIPEITESE